jgi:hypothetical protein
VDTERGDPILRGHCLPQLAGGPREHAGRLDISVLVGAQSGPCITVCRKIDLVDVSTLLAGLSEPRLLAFVRLKLPWGIECGAQVLEVSLWHDGRIFGVIRMIHRVSVLDEIPNFVCPCFFLPIFASRRLVQTRFELAERRAPSSSLSPVARRCVV